MNVSSVGIPMGPSILYAVHIMFTDQYYTMLVEKSRSSNGKVIMFDDVIYRSPESINWMHTLTTQSCCLFIGISIN